MKSCYRQRCDSQSIFVLTHRSFVLFRRHCPLQSACIAISTHLVKVSARCQRNFHQSLQITDETDTWEEAGSRRGPRRQELERFLSVSLFEHKVPL